MYAQLCKYECTDENAITLIEQMQQILDDASACFVHFVFRYSENEP